LGVPYEFQLLNLLRQLPGYTRATLEAENPLLVTRWMIYLGEEARLQRKEQERSNRRR
jgi:hypothetical protein